MYIKSIRIQNLKLLRDFELKFGPHENPRMWTVLIGENGLCKTSILRAIAMAAVGRDWSNKLADVASLYDQRLRNAIDEPLTIEGLYFDPMTRRSWMSSGLNLDPQSAFLAGKFELGGLLAVTKPPFDISNYIVAGYGIQRKLPPLQFEMSEHPVQVRLASLFEKGQVFGPNFSKLFEPQLAEQFEQALRLALVGSEKLLPHAADIRLPGKNWAQDYNGIRFESSVVTLAVGGKDLAMPALWLSPGYQSIIAIISDIIGHFFSQRKTAVPLDQMEGLVLIDELDLHLHPRWQMALIPAMKSIFPKLQFVVTTHSPLILAGAKREEIVVLTQDAEGNVVQRLDPTEHPGLLTSSQILASYFDVDRREPARLGRLVRRYLELKSAGFDAPVAADRQELETLRQELDRAGIDPDAEEPWQ